MLFVGEILWRGGLVKKERQRKGADPGAGFVKNPGFMG